MLSHLGYFWPKVNVTSQRQLISILIEEKFTLTDQSELSGSLAKPVNIVYNLPISPFTGSSEYSLPNVNDPITDELVKRVIACEQLKGRDICIEEAQELTGFMLNLTFLCMSKDEK